MTADVIVVGGGLSGLAAAVQLTMDGARVILIEQANKLGGRAYSYIDKKTGDVVDNGQHVLVGAYHNTLRYLELVGTRHCLASPKNFQLHFHHREKGFSTFAAPSFPYPFNFIWSVVTFRLMSLCDKQAILHIARQLKSWNTEFENTLRRLTVAEWLSTTPLSEESKRSFWFPVAISVMNELPQKSSALLFARSLRNTFFGRQTDVKLLIPTIGQTELYVNGAVPLLKTHGSKILLNIEAISLVIEKNRVVGVKLNPPLAGKSVRAKSVICAVPYFALSRILSERLRKVEPFAHLKKFTSSPIISIHLWFDRPVMDKEFVGLIDRTVQWVFNRRRILGETGKPQNYISAVISGAYDCIDMSKEQLVTMAVRDIASAFSTATRANIVHSIAIKEKRATFSPTNEIEPFRPSQETPIKNLYLAGDWTNTGLPPTIEGAVMSGFRCAELIVKA